MNSSSVDELLNNSIRSNGQNETSRTSSNFIAFQIGLLCIIPFVFVGNVLILWAIHKFKSLHKVTYYLLGNLAVADIIVAVGFALVNLSSLFGLGIYAFIFGNLLGFVANGISLSGTVLVSLHSFVAVRFPVRFRDGFHVKIAAFLGICTWIFWISHSLFGVLTLVFQLNSSTDIVDSFTSDYSVSKAVLNLIHLVVLVCLQLSTVLHIRKKKRRVQAQGPPGNPITSASLQRLNNTSKIVWIVSAIAVLCLIAWLPTSILVLLARFCPSCGDTAKYIPITTLGVLPNMIGNIAIYFVKSREFKKVFKALCKCRANQVHPE